MASHSAAFTYGYPFHLGHAYFIKTMINTEPFKRFKFDSTVKLEKTLPNARVLQVYRYPKVSGLHVEKLADLKLLWVTE